MLIQRTGDVEACPSGHLSCSSTNIAVAGGTDSDPLSTTPDAPVANTTYYSRPGVHRFIGIGMVIALAVVGFALWVYFAKYPRRKLAAMGLCVGRAKAGAAPKAGEAGDAALGGAPDDAEAQRAARDEKEKEKVRNLMLQAEPRGVIKEVSGGVVMYTEAPRPALPPRRDRLPTAEWAFEHVHGVRFEVSCISFLVTAGEDSPGVVGAGWAGCALGSAAPHDARSAIHERPSFDRLRCLPLCFQARSPHHLRTPSAARPRS